MEHETNKKVICFIVTVMHLDENVIDWKFRLFGILTKVNPFRGRKPH